MPRRSRPPRRPSNSGSASSKWQRSMPAGRDISRILDPAPRIEHSFDGDWFVQFMPAVNAKKTYKCPECGRNINPGIAHLVIWQEDHLFGKDRAVEERRHWHSKCWQTRRKW
ncbi:MAG: ATP/GTP-binding protein [Rothia sp. (in: high G+C Gram-positive bacteria)]|nr:ATP/GTP-binding protein [Rothia sp. (in: high G+C Gram-positive bacteria)]